MSVKYNLVVVVVGVACLCAQLVNSETNDNSITEDDNKDLIITYSQKQMLDQFKERVVSQLPHAYMKEDVYLIRWLRAKGFDLKAAEEGLMENLRWRREFRMDDIQKEDFSDVKDDFPVQIDTIDKKGQPVITAIAGQWDLRAGFLTGRDKRVLRYVYQTLDKAATMVREAQQAGKNITRFSFILSLDGFNLVQHTCGRCMIAIIDVIRLYERYYPETINRIVILNTPIYIKALFEPLIHAAITRSTLDSIKLKLLGDDRREWRHYLTQFIDEKQLPEEMGGLRERN